MTRYILSSFGQFLLTLVGVAILIFLLLRVAPGDVVEVKMRSGGAVVSADTIARERTRLGLDKPLPNQFVDWMSGLSHFDLGKSMWTERPVVEEISTRIGITLEVAVLALVIGLAVALPLGIASALSNGSWLDQAIRVFSVAGLSAPPFWLGMLLLLALLLSIGWQPPIKTISWSENPIGHLSQLICPALVVGWRLSATIARMLRSSLLDVLNEDYVRTARSKGLPERLVIIRHALGNALLPAITVAGLEFAFLLGGLVVTEQVFNLNGVGRLLVQAVGQSDFTLIQGLVLMFAVFFMVVNFAVDLLYAVLDPRLR